MKKISHGRDAMRYFFVFFLKAKIGHQQTIYQIVTATKLPETPKVKIP